jgi:hypothetical protein
MAQRGLDLKTVLVPLIRKAYAVRQRQVTVRTADPRDKMDMPCVAVNRTYDSEDKQGLANFYDNEIDPTTQGNVEIKSGLFTQNVELRIWTEDADLRDDMFNELKEILLLAKDTLAVQGFGEMRIYGGRDENDFRTYAPLFIYWGVFQFTALSPFDAFNAPDIDAKPITEIDSTVETIQVTPETI